MDTWLTEHLLWVQARNGFREPGFFGVHYWRPRELEDLFGRNIGPTSLSVDGFSSLNAQANDRDLLPFRYRLVVEMIGSTVKSGHKIAQVIIGAHGKMICGAAPVEPSA